MVAVVLAAVGGWLVVRALQNRAPPTRTIRLGLLRTEPPHWCTTPEARERELAVAAWLTFASLAPQRRRELVEAVEGALDSLEARTQPLGIDLADEPPEQALRRLSPWLLPVWTAARSLAKGCFISGDRKLTVMVTTASQAPAPGTVSFDPWQSAAPTGDVRLAQFLAWPIARARRVRATSNEPATAWRELRERAGNTGSSIALIVERTAQQVDARSLTTTDERAELAALRARFARLRSRRHSPETLSDLWLALAGDLPRAPALPWLELAPGQALVVPTLSASADATRLREEIERCRAIVLG